MFDNMRRLHPRGSLSRGVSVDADGAMLGPDCALVMRTAQGYRAIARNEANALQALVCDEAQNPGRLFWACSRIAEALGRDQLARHLFEDRRLPITVIYSPWLRIMR